MKFLAPSVWKSLRNSLPLIGLLALLPACEMESAEKEKMEREIARLRNDVLTMTEQVKKTQTELEVEKANRARADEEVKTTREKWISTRTELETTRAEYLNYKRDFHLQSRVKAVGEKHAELATKDGHTYKNVSIKAVLVDTVVFSHDDGQARVQLKALGQDWLKRFDMAAAEPVCLINENTLKEACAQAAKGQR